MRYTMATSLTETATASTTETTVVQPLQPPPGMSATSSPTKQPLRPQQRMMAFRTTPPKYPGNANADGTPNANLGMGSTGYIRRAASTDDRNLSGSGNQFYSLHPSNSPWSNFHDIFRTDSGGEVKQSRNESSLRSHVMDPLLQDDEEDEDEEERCPQDRLGGRGRDIFRPPTNRLYSPIIGTPPRWATRTINSNDAGDNPSDAVSWIPSIRPSLSCPTSVFESPLFPSHSSNALGALGNRGLGGVGAALLSQPYPLEKIISASAEHSHSHASDENGLNFSNEKLVGDENGLENADISVIECDDDDSPFHVQSGGMEHHVGNTVTIDGTNPMRNLSNAFEMLVVDGITSPPSHSKMETVQNLESHLESLTVPHARRLSKSHSRSRSGETNSTTEPSPTSVLGFGSETLSTRSNSPVTTLQLENGLTVASISMPHFHVHGSLRGSLCQGLVDRVSFYSVVRDINKEALDSAVSDPRGAVYNDGTVHGKQQGRPNGAATTIDNGTATSLPPNNGKNRVVGEDGKVHVHPNPKEERKSVLVMACLVDERNNPNEGPSEPPMSLAGDTHTGNSVAATTPSLGAALLDEEWWLMSAIASRTSEEVSMTQSSKLLPTFYEAMGEKDAATGAVAVAVEASAGQSSRTQLWKPGRSWWEAKSGKNPWVEPVVHNNRWRYLWPLIHYHKFIAKCIKKLKRNAIDVKNCTSNVSLFLRQEVCHVSDHLAFMSKYDSEEWTSALSHFDGWADHDPTVEHTLRTLVASQRLAGVAETADVQSSLLRSHIDDRILKAMQSAKQEAGRDAYDYKDVPAQCLARKDESAAGSYRQHPEMTQDNSFGVSSNRSTAWANECHLRSAIENKKRTINDTSRSNRSDYQPHPPPYLHQGQPHPPPYPHQGMYGRQFEGHPPYGPASGYGQAYGGAMNPQYYPPHPHHQYEGYHGQYPPQHPMEYHHHHGDTQYNGQYGHQQQYYNGYYHPADGSFHESMVFDNSMHAQDPYMHSSSMAQTPSRYQGGDVQQHHGQYPASPYWGHLNISQLPGLAASPSIHVTPSKPPRGNHPNRSFRKPPQPQGQHGRGGPVIDGKAKSLIMFPNQTNSPASRFVMSPQDKTNPYYAAKNSQTTVPNDNNDAPPSLLDQSAGPEESFVLPTIEDYSPESPADKAAGHASLHSNTSMDLMPPSVKKMYLGSRRQDGSLSEVSENP